MTQTLSYHRQYRCTLLSLLSLSHTQSHFPFPSFSSLLLSLSLTLTYTTLTPPTDIIIYVHILTHTHSSYTNDVLSLKCFSMYPQKLCLTLITYFNLLPICVRACVRASVRVRAYVSVCLRAANCSFISKTRRQRRQKLKQS